MSRNAHYFMWFIVFGLIAGLVSFIGGGFKLGKIDPEAYWLLGAGIIGWLLGRKEVNNGGIGRYYDIIIGVIFILAGLIGIGVHFSGLETQITNVAGGLITPSIPNDTAHLIGLSLALFPAIVHVLLGFISLRHGIDNSAKK